MSFLDIALRNAARGFRVHPLRGKDAFLPDWPNVATTNEAIIRAMAEKYPDCNVGIAAGITLAIVDTDRKSRLAELCGASWVEWSRTYTVSSGRPDRCHLYYLATEEVLAFGNKRWKEAGHDGNVFELKVMGGQVVAEGSVHPDTGEVYRITQDLPLIPFPAGLFYTLKDHWSKQNPTGKREWSLPVHDGEGRDDFLISQAGKLRNLGASEAVIRAYLDDLNEDPAVMADPKSNEDLDRIARSAARYDVPPLPIQVTVGRSATPKKAATDWRTHYHTREEAENTPKPEFLIEGFLQRQSIVGIAGFVAHKKSFIALNMSHSLCSGEPLFGKFRVVRKAKRVLYLCPEMGLTGFTDRVKKIGLMPYVGDTFFYATMSLKDGVVRLPDLTPEEISEAVIFLDTAIRFVEGNENSSEDMKGLASDAFALIRNGAECVIFLCHSNKSMTSSGELTLENAMRGSGELSAFLFSCWATRMQDPDNAYETANLLKQVKSRDFESKPFEVTTSRETCRMTFVEGSEGAVIVGKIKKPDADGKEEAALQVIRNNPNLSAMKIAAKLKALGIQRSATWVGNKRHDLFGTGVKTSIGE